MLQGSEQSEGESGQAAAEGVHWRAEQRHQGVGKATLQVLYVVALTKLMTAQVNAQSEKPD